MVGAGDTGIITSAQGIAGACVLAGTPCLTNGDNNNEQIGKMVSPTGIISSADGSCQPYGAQCQLAGNGGQGVINPTNGQCAAIGSSCCLPGGDCTPSWVTGTANPADIGVISGFQTGSFGQCVPTYDCQVTTKTNITGGISITYSPGTILNGNCASQVRTARLRGLEGMGDSHMRVSCIGFGSTCSIDCSTDPGETNFSLNCNPTTYTLPGVVTQVEVMGQSVTPTCVAAGSACVLRDANGDAIGAGILSSIATSAGPSGTCVSNSTTCTTTDGLSGVIGENGATCIALGSQCQSQDDFGGTVYGVAGPNGCEITPGSSCYTKGGTEGVVGEGQNCYVAGTEGAFCTANSTDGGILKGTIDSDGNCGVPYASNCTMKNGSVGITNGTNCLQKDYMRFFMHRKRRRWRNCIGSLNENGDCEIKPGLVCSTVDGSVGAVGKMVYVLQTIKQILQ